jgi:alanyl-tRNA synthetase
MVLTRVGQTAEGKTVYARVYKFFETHGMPLDTLLGILREKNVIPCWVSFHREARAAGMKHERILSKLDEALSDVYGPEFRDHVIEMLRLLEERGLLT